MFELGFNPLQCLELEFPQFEKALAKYTEMTYWMGLMEFSAKEVKLVVVSKYDEEMLVRRDIQDRAALISSS